MIFFGRLYAWLFLHQMFFVRRRQSFFPRKVVPKSWSARGIISDYSLGILKTFFSPSLKTSSPHNIDYVRKCTEPSRISFSTRVREKLEIYMTCFLWVLIILHHIERIFSVILSLNSFEWDSNFDLLPLGHCFFGLNISNSQLMLYHCFWLSHRLENLLSFFGRQILLHSTLKKWKKMCNFLKYLFEKLWF